MVLGVGEAAEHRGGPGGAGDHVTQGDRGQGGGVTEHLHTPGVGHVTGHAASDGVGVRGRGHGGGPGHVGDHLHTDTGQTGLAVLRIMQGYDKYHYDKPHQEPHLVQSPDCDAVHGEGLQVVDGQSPLLWPHLVQ